VIKLLIVEDSALMRRQLLSIFDVEGDFEIKLARNGREAVEENKIFQPDVITMDINMPEMDGLTALSILMIERPVAVVMVSSLTEKGALATFEALALGAVDYVTKPGGTISLSIEEIRQEMLDKVRAAARAKPKSKSLTRPALAKPGLANTGLVRPEKSGGSNTATGIVIIGVSTGGPRTLEDILPLLPADFPFPVLVAQHMPANFTTHFANRMNKLCAMNVVEATSPMKLAAGTIYIGRGGADMIVTKRNGALTVLPKPESDQHLWHPSVELLGRSVIEHCDISQVIAVMLTGMGNDGSVAFTEIMQKGGRTIAESEDSCVVFGMPAQLISRGGASTILSSNKIAQQIVSWSR
jgi:two-component system chemotaxis response regulator CheB